MSPTTGTVRHPDVSEISELTEGLLSPARTAEVRAHLGDCALCADVRASLEEIRALLGTLPGPARMPADISGRIDAALAAEALLDATTPAGSGTTARSGPSDGRTGSGVSRETPPAPLPGTGGLRPSGHPAGPTGPGRRRARRRIALAGGLLAACAAGVLLFNLTSGPEHEQDMSARPDVASAEARSAAHAYTAQGLQGSVRELLTSAGPEKKAPGEQNNTFGLESGSPPAPELAPGDREAPGVPACVQKATGRTESPLAFENGSFQGSDVFLLVLPHPGDPASVDAYVIRSACVATPGAPAEKPLLTSTYPRS
ncbi:anti-sigma factor family protein [Streptomyces sp. NPDC054961]